MRVPISRLLAHFLFDALTFVNFWPADFDFLNFLLGKPFVGRFSVFLD